MPDPDPASPSAAATDEAPTLLDRARAGDAVARDQFVALLYAELRRLAHGQRRRAGAGETVNTTALVHEAFEKLAGQSVAWTDRPQTLRFAARAMRDVLVDYARAQSAAKRGGPGRALSLDGMDDVVGAPSVRIDEVLTLDTALHQLAEVNPDAARVVELRYFAGLTAAETADALDISEKTVQRRWIVARAWLHATLADPDAL